MLNVKYSQYPIKYFSFSPIGLKEMLMEDEELSDRADFDVEIVKLT